MQFLSTDTPSCFIESSISNRFHHFLYQSSPPSPHPRFPFFPSFHIKQARIDFRLLAINRPPLPTLAHLPHFQITWSGTCNQVQGTCLARQKQELCRDNDNKIAAGFYDTQRGTRARQCPRTFVKHSRCIVRDTVVAAQQYDHKEL